jgi:hypothetical protein
MKLYLLVGTAFMLAMSTYAHAGPTSTQDGPGSMTKPNGDAGITAPMQKQPYLLRRVTSLRIHNRQ